jgi:hypothetical protein
LGISSEKRNKRIGNEPVKRLFYLLLTSFCVGGCDYFGNEQKSGAIDSPVQVSLAQDLTPDGAMLVVSSATVRIYPCVNAWILHETVINGNLITIHLTGIFQPEICLTALGPATASISLNSLAEGEYSIDFIVNNYISSFKLGVTAETYSLTGSSTPWIQLKQPVLGRIPRGTIWGCIGYGTGDDGEPTPSPFVVLIALQEAGGTDLALSPGDYGHFEIDEEGNLVTPSNLPYPAVRTFLMRYDGAESDLEEIVDWVGKTYGAYLGVELNTDKGGRYYSWVNP